MKATVYSENIETGELRLIGTVVYDSTSRAIQMYQDECGEMEQLVLVDED